jgi:hypothetical protein
MVLRCWYTRFTSGRLASIIRPPVVVDEPGDGWGKKPIWYVFQAAGTPRQAEVFAPYLPVVGIKSWEEAVYKGPTR